MTRIYAISALALVAAMLGAMAWFVYARGGAADPFAPCRATQVAGGAATIGGPFTLIGTGGQTLTETEVITGPTLIYFGYTWCPDICPLDTARNAAAVDLLDEMGIYVTPVFISVDPGRDTPEVVGEFVRYVHPRLVGLTGSEDQVRRALQAYRGYARAQEGDPERYLVDHSTFTYLVTPDNGFLEFYRRDAAPEAIAGSVACFLRIAEGV